MFVNERRDGDEGIMAKTSLQLVVDVLRRPL